MQYAGATSTTWSVTNLSSVSLLPGHYYLIQEASGGAVGVSLPTPDATGTTAMSATAGKVALVNSTTALSGSGCPFGVTVVDFVGYGTTADCFEGAGRAPAPSNTNADVRAGGGCTDTDVNSTNFATGAPAPRNTASAANQCPGTIAPPAFDSPLKVGANADRTYDWRRVFSSMFERSSLTSRHAPWFLN